MKEALSYIEAEVHLQNIFIEKFYEELNKTDFLISKAHWQHEIKTAKAQILQLENVKHLLEKWEY